MPDEPDVPDAPVKDQAVPDAPGPDDVEGKESNLDALPEWAQREVRRLRRESANARVTAREHAALLDERKTDHQKAIEAAKADGAKATRAQYGERLARAELRGVLKGLVDDPNEIIDDLNLSKYVDDDGEVDDDAVKALAARYEKLAGPRKQGASRLGGARTTGGGAKSTAEQFAEAMDRL